MHFLRHIQLLSPSSRFGIPWQRDLSSMSGINGKHYKGGSKCPEFSADKVTVINMRFCPFAQRTLLVLLKKNVPFDNLNVNLTDKPEWLWKVNPLGKVPAIQIGDKIIYESMITCDYIDKVYDSGPKLNQEDPYQDAQDRMLIERFSQVLGPHYKLYFQKPEELSTDQRSEWCTAMLDKLFVLEEALEARKTPYLGGEAVKMVDYMIWPWFERILVMPKFLPECKLQPERFPLLLKWIDLMEQDSAVKAYRIVGEDHLALRKSKLDGTMNYDILADRL